MSDFSAMAKEANLGDGAWIGADDGRTIDVLNPADGTCIARIPNAGAAETRRAIEAASRAFPAYSALSVAERTARSTESNSRARFSRLPPHSSARVLTSGDRNSDSK